MERLPVAANRPGIGYAFALAACIAALLIRFAAQNYLQAGYPFVAFFPAVILTTFLFGARPGLLAALLSWLLARWFFIEPRYELGFAQGVFGALFFFICVVLIDIGIIYLMQRANRLLREQRERSFRRYEVSDAMFHELQHRVSNKLQIIASLLTLQKRTVTDPDAKKALEGAALRVGMIGRIGRALYDPDRGGLGVAAFLEQVGHDIIEASGAANVRLIVEAEAGVEFGFDAGVPIALIIAETISNALEHGFQSKGHGSIHIRVQRGEGASLLVTVADDGRGVAEDFDAADSPSLGLKIATTLARQLNGSYSLYPGERGSVARLRVEALDTRRAFATN
ncbi:sensor histidine kinase [Sphingobium sp.]|uniref:sensor histidine kinase n=1 Tax=Sphingobium sp. TaxID=1912891 RepID=UPI002ED5441F